MSSNDVTLSQGLSLKSEQVLMDPAKLPRPTPQYVTMRVEGLLRSYPQAKPDDPKTYILGICAILTGYPQEVVDYVTAPVTGIQTRIKHHPVQAEVRAACEDRMAFLFRRFEHQERPKTIEAKVAEREAEKAERENRPSYDDLIAKYGPNFGLKTLDTIEEEQRAAASARRRLEREHARIAQQWIDAGKEPPTIAGIVVSPSLAALIEKQTGIPATNGGSPKEGTHDAA